MTAKREISKEMLIQYYTETNNTVKEVANILKCNPTTIRKYLALYEIPIDVTRNYKKMSEGLKNSDKIKNMGKKMSERFMQEVLPKDKLYHEYIELNKSTRECAKIFGCGRKSISKYLKIYGIVKTQEMQHQKLSEHWKDIWKDNDNLKKKASDILNHWRKENPAEAQKVALESNLKLQQWKKEHPEETQQQVQKLIDNCTSLETIQKNLEKWGVPYPCMRKECREASGNIISNYNKQWIKYLQILCNKDLETEFSISNYSYDIYLKGTNIVLEINPSITHNSTINFFSKKEGKNKDYHFKKSQIATQNGYHCIHVWDWDDRNKILNIFKKKEKIYARSTEIKEISIKETDNFNNLYHLQNTCRGQQVCLGLYHNKELVSLMSFGKPRYNKNYQWELLRYTTHPDYMVIGGAEKLFKYFVNEYKPKNIISYCDYSKFSGQVYKKLGFNLKSHTKPSCHWVNRSKHFTQNLVNQYGVDKLLSKNYGKGTNNQELLIKEGFVQVYDCGQLVFIKDFIV